MADRRVFAGDSFRKQTCKPFALLEGQPSADPGDEGCTDSGHRTDETRADQLEHSHAKKKHGEAMLIFIPGSRSLLKVGPRRVAIHFAVMTHEKVGSKDKAKAGSSRR